jgi:hypothetical protein
MRWVAAALAAIVLIPYCLQLRHARMRAPGDASTVATSNDGEIAATTTRGRTAERGGPAPPTRPNLTTPSAVTPSAAPAAAPTSATPPARATATALPPVTSDDWSRGKFVDFTPDELADMATRCELRWQLPRTPSDRYQAAVRALYVELTGDESERSLRILDDTLRVGSDDDALPVHKRLADRRAGAAVEPGGSVYERYLQLQLDESERGQRDGDEPGPKLTMTGCDSGSALFRSGR